MFSCRQPGVFKAHQGILGPRRRKQLRKVIATEILLRDAPGIHADRQKHERRHAALEWREAPDATAAGDFGSGRDVF